MSAVYEGVAQIVKGMKRSEKAKLLDTLLKDSALLEDVEDAIVIARRRHEQGESLQKFAQRMRRKGRLK